PAVGCDIANIIGASRLIALLKLRRLLEERRQNCALARDFRDKYYFQLSDVVDRNRRSAAREFSEPAFVNADTYRGFQVLLAAQHLEPYPRFRERLEARALVKLVAHCRSHPRFHERRQVARLH